ncbi:MAG: Stp1/IreP family PP2C-type Ser/Thr phosphatase [Gammaproteobacteria bacterium]
MNLSSVIEIATVTDTGLKRPHNEDSAVTSRAAGLAVVADGMGGYKAGEVASAIAAKCIIDKIEDGLEAAHSAEQNGAEYRPESELIRDAIIEANAHIFQTAQTVQQCQGMGTTVVAILLYDNMASIAHVGDSRIYRYRDEILSQVTNDHSLVQELIDRGFFTAEEAEANTPKNLVTRALGIDGTVEVDIVEEPVQPNDIYLLCSDGLNDMVNDEEIRLTLSKYSGNLHEAASELVRLANEMG